MTHREEYLKQENAALRRVLQQLRAVLDEGDGRKAVGRVRELFAKFEAEARNVGVSKLAPDLECRVRQLEIHCFGKADGSE